MLIDEMRTEGWIEHMGWTAVPVYHYPCARTTVVVGRWGHTLAHPSDCPDCKRAYRPEPQP